ncbi:MAG TPA: motility protein MotB, partial [Pseudomonas sp.]|nr:motility protein MotB [Pseudomonas sp.]
FDRKDPFNPINRRIDILVLTRKAQRNIEGEQASGGEEEGGPAPAGPAPADGAAAPPAEPLQAPQLRERLNIFEDGALRFDQPPAD